MSLKTVLTIAGSDCSGGAGIQADLKTITMNGCYGMSVITALTAQNTTGVSAIENVTPAMVRAQLDVIFTDIPPDAIKIGMLSSAEIVETIAERLRFYHAKNIVLDPVMVATSGASLSTNAAIQEMQSALFPLATVITPNLPEAETLLGASILNDEAMRTAAKTLAHRYHCAVLLKGGHRLTDANDLLYLNDTFHWFNAKHITNPNTHGTGCTLSSAIAAHLAKGLPLIDAITAAKTYLTNALLANLNLGKGKGPLNHLFALSEHFNCSKSAPF